MLLLTFKKVETRNLLLSHLINCKGQLYEILLLQFRLLEVSVEWMVNEKRGEPYILYTSGCEYVIIILILIYILNETRRCI